MKTFWSAARRNLDLEAENYIMSIAAMRSFAETGLEGSNPQF